MLFCLLENHFLTLNMFAFSVDFPSRLGKGLTAFLNFAKIDLSDEEED